MSARNYAILILAGAVAVATSPAIGTPAVAAGGEPGSSGCDYGIALALLGRTASAESVFVALLDESPGDARALNNLGNIRFLSGEPDVAAAFYGMAATRDTSDAGILLNRATALMVQGDVSQARMEARRAIGRAGGMAAAAEILGLASGSNAGGAPKASEGAAVSEEEIRALLLQALENVPVDSAGAPVSVNADTLAATSADTSATGPAEPGRASPSPAQTRVWRTAGPRASEARTDPGILYWKR